MLWHERFEQRPIFLFVLPRQVVPALRSLANNRLDKLAGCDAGYREQPSAVGLRLRLRDLRFVLGPGLNFRYCPGGPNGAGSGSDELRSASRFRSGEKEMRRRADILNSIFRQG